MNATERSLANNKRMFEFNFDKRIIWVIDIYKSDTKRRSRWTQSSLEPF